MKDRLLTFLKWFFIVLGILFLLQILIMSGIFISFNSLFKPDFKPIEIKQPKINKNIKEIQSIIDYAEKYREDNNKYPDSVDIKVKKGEYSYKTTNNSTCYEIIYSYKDTQKNYNKCMSNSDGFNSVSESYSEVNK